VSKQKILGSDYPKIAKSFPGTPAPCSPILIHAFGWKKTSLAGKKAFSDRKPLAFAGFVRYSTKSPFPAIVYKSDYR
jgi:hypothetical protein